MSSQTLVWTALPNAFDGTHAKALNLSVYLSPRLITDSGNDGHLDPDFQDFIDWPATVSKIAFQISFGGGAPITVAQDHAVLDSVLWTALFERSTVVRSHRFRDEFATRRIRSYPVSEVHKTVRQIHQAMIPSGRHQTAFVSGPQSRRRARPLRRFATHERRARGSPRPHRKSAPAGDECRIRSAIGT